MTPLTMNVRGERRLVNAERNSLADEAVVVTMRDLRTGEIVEESPMTVSHLRKGNCLLFQETEYVLLEGQWHPVKPDEEDRHCIVFLFPKPEHPPRVIDILG